MVEKTLPGGFWPHLFDPIQNFGSKVHDWLAPAAQATAADDHYGISMELPGVAEEDIDLSVDAGVVTVKGEKKSSREEKGDTWYFSERQYGAFSRSFRLPADADESSVQASLKDGVLQVRVAKVKPTAKASASKVKIKKG